ncbi:MAG: DNA-protecting protein DprA [Spirochaetia bacterium]|nr:DNA-protecting protein DprA [Spirochaetia bacterium]
MDKTNKYSQIIACFTLHIAGQSGKMIFKNLSVIDQLDFIKVGETLFGNKFISMMQNAKETLNNHLDCNINVITVIENEYPVLLKKSLNPPLALFYIGNLSILSKPLISIVGTRKPSIITIHWVKEICYYLSKQGFTLASGLAIGIDTIVHANSYLRGTIGVAAQSLDIRSPKINAYLFEEAMHKKSEVLLLSEYPLKTPARKYHFINRNRIIAGISESTIFAEGGMNSGAMITANWCLKRQKKLYAIHSKFQKNNEGNNYLLSTNQAVNISEAFPVNISRKKSEEADAFFIYNTPYYLGDDEWLFIDKKNFSTKFLLSDQQDPDFVQCID